MAIARVILWGREIGAVTDNNGVIEFSYNPDFIGSGIELAPLAMPVNNTVYSFSELSNEKPYYGLPGMLSDSLPDSYGNLMIQEYLERYGKGRTKLSPIERLCYTGKRGMGALEYEPATSETKAFDEIDIGELTALAEKILTKRQDLIVKENEKAMQQLLQVGSSAGGARAKALIAWDEENHIIKSGQIDAGPGFAYWLLKFDRMTNNSDLEQTPDDIDSTRVEYAYYLMAKDADIKMSESRLYRDGDCAHFITKRFDRLDSGEKLHMVSLCGMAHMNFTQRHIYDYVDIANVIDRLNLGKKSVEEIFKRMVFNDMTFNFDDHVKNTAFLMDKDGNWSLAPAYDMTFAYDPSGQWTNTHQMLINGKAIDVSTEDYLAAGKRMGLSSNRMNVIINQITEVTREFESYAKKAQLREERIAYIKSLFQKK